METPSVRVLVLGDSGVGKTTLLRAICRSQLPHSSYNDKVSSLWTTGCDVHVLLKALEPSGPEIFVEFLDIGGHHQYELSRNAFYHNVHGMMFVHDLSNIKSKKHLRHWSKEVNTIQKRKGCVVPSIGYKTEHHCSTLQDVPKLLVGTKKDLVSRTYRMKTIELLEFVDFRTASCIESCAEPLLMEPSGAFDTFLQQTLAFATRRNGRDRYSSNYDINNVGLRQTLNKSVEQDDGRSVQCAKLNNPGAAMSSYP